MKDLSEFDFGHIDEELQMTINYLIVQALRRLWTSILMTFIFLYYFYLAKRTHHFEFKQHKFHLYIYTSLIIVLAWLSATFIFVIRRFTKDIHHEVAKLNNKGVCQEFTELVTNHECIKFTQNAIVNFMTFSQY